MLFLNALLSTLSLLSLSTLLQSTGVSASPRPRYLPQGTITSPANGTAVAPGASFAFTYAARGDYCLGSQNFSVWLLTSKDAPDSAAALFAGIDGNGGVGDDSNAPTGYYFGRFAYSSNINEFPPNPAPSSLTMPDFSQPSGWGSGKSVSDQTVYLAVLEEYSDCSSSLGSHFGLAVNTLVYNATSS